MNTIFLLFPGEKSVNIGTSDRHGIWDGNMGSEYLQPTEYRRLRIVTGIRAKYTLLDVWCAEANDRVACACVGVLRGVFVAYANGS